MREFVSREECSGISRMFSIGKSRNGTHMWALEISNNPGKGEGKPNFKYVANMHGDEPSGRYGHTSPVLRYNVLAWPSFSSPCAETQPQLSVSTIFCFSPLEEF